MKNQKGVSLVELILYVSIVSVILSALIPFAWNVIGGSVKSSVEQEVYSQGRFLSERIKYEIRNASGINSVTVNSISLQNFNPVLDPTVITYSTNEVTIAQGVGSPVRLHSQSTIVTTSSDFFTNFSSSDNKTQHIGFEFTIQDNYPVVRQEYQESANFKSSAELRSN